MSDDQDYSQLPVEEKIVHNVWKVRLQGYTELIAQFEASRNEQDPCFSIFHTRPDTLKSIVLDSNVVAQESAVLLVCKYLEFGFSAAHLPKLKTSGIVPALCEKGLASSRAGTKAKSVDALLLLAEVSDSADWIIELIVPYLENRLPKLVAGCVHALLQLVSNYGCVVVPPKLILPSLAKLFAHADRNVRAETTKLTVELYIWLHAGLTSVLFPSLKPVQQRDLTAEFDKVEDAKPEQKRLTRAQKQELAARQQRDSELESGDVIMADAQNSTSAESAPAFDPYDLMEPVDVLSQMPPDLYTRAASAKWKDRVEALEEVQGILSKAPKLKSDDYTDLVRLFAKCFKDANLQVVQLAASGIVSLANGLKAAFSKYRHLVLPPLIERTKEKKPAVAEVLASALDSIFASSSLSDILDDTLAGMQHKTPQVKIASTNFLQRCLANTTIAPKRVQVDQIMLTGVKLLTDSQEPIRQAATEMTGTLMKITGERELKAMLEKKVDDNRLAKVRAAFENASVKVSGNSAGAVPAVSSTRLQKPEASPKLGSSTHIGATPALQRADTTASIPSKRLATSPAKRARSLHKPQDKPLTGRSLIPPVSSVHVPSAQSVSEPVRSQQSSEEISSLKEEIRHLKEENRRLKEENDSGMKAQNALMDDLRIKNQEVLASTEQADQLRRDNTNYNLMMKQKETQIMRLTSDLENAKLKIRSLEQDVEMMKFQQPMEPVQPSAGFSRESFASPGRFSLPRHASAELSSRVNRLSIEGSAAIQSSPQDQDRGINHDEPFTGVLSRANSVQSHHYPERDRYSAEDNKDENWKKATEVTAQLKARIEKMKQRNRLANI